MGAPFCFKITRRQPLSTAFLAVSLACPALRMYLFMYRQAAGSTAHESRSLQTLWSAHWRSSLLVSSASCADGTPRGGGDPHMGDHLHRLHAQGAHRPQGGRDALRRRRGEGGLLAVLPRRRQPGSHAAGGALLDGRVVALLDGGADKPRGLRQRVQQDRHGREARQGQEAARGAVRLAGACGAQLQGLGDRGRAEQGAADAADARAAEPRPPVPLCLPDGRRPGLLGL